MPSTTCIGQMVTTRQVMRGAVPTWCARLDLVAAESQDFELHVGGQPRHIRETIRRGIEFREVAARLEPEQRVEMVVRDVEAHKAHGHEGRPDLMDDVVREVHVRYGN